MLSALEWLALLWWALGVILGTFMRLHASEEDDVRGLWPYLVNVVAILFWPIPIAIYLGFLAVKRLRGR